MFVGGHLPIVATSSQANVVISKIRTMLVPNWSESPDKCLQREPDGVTLVSTGSRHLDNERVLGPPPRPFSGCMAPRKGGHPQFCPKSA